MSSAPAKIRTGITHRWAVASRAFAAVVGGYIFTVATSVFLAAIAPTIFGTSKAHSVHAGLSFSFLFYLLIVMWVFAASSAKKAWFWLIALTLLFGGSAYVLDTGGVS